MILFFNLIKEQLSGVCLWQRLARKVKLRHKHISAQIKAFQDLSTSPEEIYLCLEVDSDSNFIIQVRLSSTQYTQQISGFKAQTGWTWFAITVSNQFQISTITFYATNELYTGLTAAIPFKSEQFVIAGMFGTSAIPDPLSANNILSYGCNYDKNLNCNNPLIGYFYESKIWNVQALTSTQLAFEVQTTCTGGCIICATIDSQCFSAKSLSIVDLDLEQNTQTLTDSSGNSNSFIQGLTTTASTADYDPIRIPEQGMRFSKTSFIKAPSAYNLPHGILVEAWIRFDLNNIISTGSIQYIYECQRNSNKFSIGLDYNLIKVKVNQAEANYFIDWKQSTNWRYIGVTFMRNSQDDLSYTSLKVGTTNVKIYIDNGLVSTQNIPAIFTDDQSGTNSDVIGQNFHGVIKRFRISATTLCNLATSTSVSTTCTAYGATTSCSICDKSSQICYSKCPLNTIDNQCTPCNWKCRYCFTDVNTCTACEKSKFLIGTPPTCNCAAGYLEQTSQCTACHSNCATCLDTTNSNCPVCSATAYLYAGKSCLSECPYGYLKDSIYHLCHFQTQKLIQPINQLDYLNKNCDDNQYATGAVCSSCHSTCYTCKGGSSTDCTSCDLGKYLYNSQCLTCDATGMILGSSGQCVEKCGDGKNFGLVKCDDGNSIDGDGCSSTCEIEQDWICYGGTSSTADTCTISQLTIESIEATSDNNIVITFSKPAYIIDELDTDDIEIRITKYDGSYVENFNAKFTNIEEQPTQTLFVQLFIQEFLQGQERKSRVEVFYKKSGKIFDTKLNELQTYTDAFTFIERNFPEMTNQEKDAIKGMGILINIVIVFTIGITAFLSIKFFDYPLDMKFFWKNFSWVQLEFHNMIPNTFSKSFMDMNQIQQGSYTDNYQFLTQLFPQQCAAQCHLVKQVLLKFRMSKRHYHSNPVIQALAVSILQFSFLIYVFSSRPFQSTYNNVLSMISQLFPFILSVYSLSFNGSKNDPEKAFNYGWGAILMVSVYCLTYAAIAMIANIYHILDRAEFAQRYTQEIEDKIRMTILSIFYRKGAAKEQFVKQGGKLPEQKPLQPSNVVEQQIDTVKQDPISFVPEPFNQPLQINNQFKGPMGINDNGKNMDHLFQSSNKSQNNNKMLPAIDGHKTKIDPRMLITPKEFQSDQLLDQYLQPNAIDPNEKDEDLSDPDDKNEIDLGDEAMMNTTQKSKKKTKKVKKKVKSKKKKNFFGETIKDLQEGNIDSKNKGEYVLL
eukprot:403332874